jgi:phytoene/squalene synthetase
MHARALGRAYQIINFIRDYDEDVANGYHYITDNFSAYLEIFYQDIDMGMDGLDYIPEHLQEPIIMATKKYMEVANEAQLL